MLSVLLCCAAIFAVSSARPDGAPLQACGDLTPRSLHGPMGQPTPNPWTIDICDFDEIMGYYTYTPGRSYNITLRPAQGASLNLRGFFIQGRSQLTNIMLGAFDDPNPLNPNARLSSCLVNTTGVTHTNNLDKPGPLTFTWTAPSIGSGPIWFRYTVVQNLGTWWANDSSAIVQEVNNLVFSSAPSQLPGVGFWTLMLAAVGVALKTVL